MTVKVSVTVTQVREDGTEGPVDGELAAALAGPAGRFSEMLSWTARQAWLDHGKRECALAESGRELQWQLLEATFAIDCAREERAGQAARPGSGTAAWEKGHDRGVVSIFGPVRAGRLAYRNRREASLYPADARWILPEDPYSMGMRALVACHLAEGGYGQAGEVIEARTGARIGPAQLAGIAGDLAGWTDEFYDQRAFSADTGRPDSDVIMMQADGTGIALRPGHRASAGKATDSAHPGIKKIVLHGRARAVAATLASVAAKARARNSRPDLTDVGKAVTYLTNNHQRMRYGKALASGWPIATGMIEGACRFVIEDRFGITGARWSPGGADVILKLPAVVVNGDLDDYMTYYKQRYLEDIHLTRYHPDSIPSLGLTA